MDLQIDRCLQFFSQILNVLKSSQRYEPVFHLIVDRIVRLYRCQSCAVVLIHPRTEYLNIENSYGISLTFCKEFRKKLTTGAVGELLWTGHPVLIANSDECPEHAGQMQLEAPFGSCIAVQIACNHRTAGYLYADSREHGAFGERDIAVFQTLADIAGVAIEKYRLAEENLRLETIDRETGAEKFGPFLERARAALERAENVGSEFSLMIMDVDNFKEIMITYSHESALELLKEMGRLVSSRLRQVGAIGRHGFDEFIVLLENTTMEEGVEAAKAVRHLIEATPFTSRGIRSTVSIGLSSYPRNAETLDELIVTAKNALFEAQRAGRNNVFHYLKEWYAKEHVLDER